MKKLIFLLLFLIASCTVNKFVPRSYQTYQQLDSILTAEKVLTYDSMALQDYQTKKWFYEYFFIRDSLVIRWIPRGDSVQITKRINK